MAATGGEAERSPKNIVRLWSRASRASADGRWQIAAAAWREITAANPFEGQAWDMLGQALYETEALSEAASAFERALTLGTGPGTNQWRFPSQIAYSIAQCTARLGELDKAREWFRRALELGYRDTAGAREDTAIEALRDLPEFRQLLSPPDTSAMTREEGLRFDLDLFRSEVKRRARRPFPRLDEAAFDQAVNALAIRATHLHDDQILVELSRLMVMVGDGHSGVSHAGDTLPLRLPLELYLFDQPEDDSADPPGLVVIAAVERHRDLLGGSIVAIGETPAREVVSLLEPILTRDNDWQLKQSVVRTARSLPHVHGLGIVDSTQKATVTVRLLDGAVTTLEIEGERYERARTPPLGWVRWVDTLPDGPPLCFRNIDEPFWFTHLQADRVLYVQLNAVRDDPAESLERFASRLSAAIEREQPSRLVLDVRWNGGGNTFLLMPLLHMIIGSPMNRRGALFVITGRDTFSAAQNFSTLLWRHTQATFVGEPTGSCPNFIGETCPFELPYTNLEVNVSDLYWGTSWPLDSRTALAPLVYSPPTVKAWAAGRDPAMDAILSLDERLPRM